MKQQKGVYQVKKSWIIELQLSGRNQVYYWRMKIIYTKTQTLQLVKMNIKTEIID
jgi:hypothetical protein